MTEKFCDVCQGSAGIVYTISVVVCGAIEKIDLCEHCAHRLRPPAQKSWQPPGAGQIPRLVLDTLKKALEKK